MKNNLDITFISPAKSNKQFVTKPPPHSFGHKTSIAAIQHSEKESFSFPMLRDEWLFYLLSWKGYTGLYSGRKTQMRNVCLSWKRMQTCMKWKPSVCSLLTDQFERSTQNWTVRKNKNKKTPKQTKKQPNTHSTIPFLPSSPSTYSHMHIYTQASSLHVIKIYPKLKCTFFFKSITQ